MGKIEGPVLRINWFD
uniref:Uncharacterized protein n=1 Tax=Rhizophora mucronata TaxID=61149 RepID=A0A2P2NH28_RHIMU